MTQLTTFLAQNKFYSAVDIPSAADEAGASAPAPTPDAPAALSACTALTRTCPNRDVRMDEAASDASSERQATAAIDSCQEPVAADNFEDDLARLIGVAGKRRRLKLPRFVPDYEDMEAAINDPGAPRFREDDPMWTDASPLFLRDTA